MATFVGKTKAYMKIISKISLIVYAIGSIAHTYYANNLDFINISESQSQIEWYIKVFRDVGAMTAVSLAIILSISSYPLSNKKYKEKAYIVASILVCMIFLLLPSYAYYKMEDLKYKSSGTLLKNEKFIMEYNNNLKDDDIEILKRVQYSNNIASMIYRDTKTIINVVKPNGIIEAYSPTSEDDEMRIDLIQANKLMEHTKKTFRDAIFIWASILAFSTITGVFLARRKISL